MNPSSNCYDLIKQFEGLYHHAYVCPAGVLTIGYGTTAGVYEGMKVSTQEALDLLVRDCEAFAEGVTNLVKVPLTQNQFDALVCFTYNVGMGNFAKSTMLKLLNQSKYEEAGKEFTKWNKAGGKVLAGLTRRREAEMKLFNTKE